MGRCKCVNVYIGDYTNQVILSIPNNIKIYRNDGTKTIRKEVCVDRCIADEVSSLWEIGIITTGCCCGHNKKSGYIGVKNRYIDGMKALGYNQYGNKEDTFYPNT